MFLKPRKPKPDVAAIAKALGLPAPKPEYRFHPTRLWRFDYAWPTQKVALEIEGGIWTNGRHTRGKGYLGDMDKYNEAAIHGWKVIRCTPQQIYSSALESVQRAMNG